jgi:hypothetical protein
MIDTQSWTFSIFSISKAGSAFVIRWKWNVVCSVDSMKLISFYQDLFSLLLCGDRFSFLGDNAAVVWSWLFTCMLCRRLRISGAASIPTQFSKCCAQLKTKNWYKCTISKEGNGKLNSEVISFCNHSVKYTEIEDNKNVSLTPLKRWHNIHMLISEFVKLIFRSNKYACIHCVRHN